MAKKTAKKASKKTAKAPARKSATKTTKKTAKKAAPKKAPASKPKPKAAKSAPKAAAPAKAVTKSPAAKPIVPIAKPVLDPSKYVNVPELIQNGDGDGKGTSDAVGKRIAITPKKPLVELSRGKEPIELHHRPLTRKELNELRDALVTHLKELTDDVDQMETEILNVDKDSVASTDVVESSSAQYEQDIKLLRVEEESSEISEVKRALAKIDGKLRGFEYGKCEATGLWISIERLRAMPHARLCVAAVERFEREGGGEEYGIQPIR